MPRKFLTSLFISIASMVIITACQFKEPVLPAWETTFRISFNTEEFILGEEMVNDSTIIIQSGDPDSILYIALKDSGVDLREISAGDLSIKLDNASEKITLDTLVISTLQTLDVPLINLGSIFPGLTGAIGQTVTVPETTVTAPPTVLYAGDFKRIHFLSGIIRLHVVNKLPFPVGPNSSAPDGLRITVVNDSLNETFAEFTFPNTILPGKEAVSEATIENKWLYSPLRLEYLIPVSQPTTVSVTSALLDTAGAALSVSLENIRADEAVALLEAQNFSEVIQLGYEDKHRLRSAEIDQGQFKLSLTNHTPLDTEVKIQIPALQNASNDTFVTEVELPAQETMPLTLQLDGYTISNPDLPGATPGNLVYITSNDSIAVNIVTDTLIFKSFSGFLGEDTLGFDPIIEEEIAKYEGFEGGIQLNEAFLNLKIYSEILIDNLTANIVITGFHRNESGVITDSATIVLNDQKFNGGTPAQPGITEISLMGQEIVDFLSILPTAIRVNGRAKVSGEAVIAQGNRIWVDYLFETPFKVHIQGTASFEGKESLIREEDIDELIQDAAADNILDADFTFFLTNFTPLRGNIRFILSADFSDPDIYDENYDTSRVIIRDIPVEPAPVDPLTGFVINAREDEILLHLNQQEVQLFSSPPLRYGYQLIVPDTGGFITLRYSDFVKMLGRADLHVLVGDQ
jgi:hypothetical protein